MPYIIKLLIYIVISIIVFIISYIGISKFFKFVEKLDEKFEKQIESENLRNENYYQKDFYNKSYESKNYTYEKSEYYKEEPIMEENKEIFPECLNILGFTKYPESVDDIKKRYKKLMKIYHPDGGGTREEYDRITNAYEESLTLDRYKNT